MKRPSSNPAAAVLTLYEAAQALARAGVTAWLTDGTLLGAIRERSFIEHDQDMDLGAMITEHHDGVLPALEAAGFRLRRALGTPERGLEHKLERNGLHLDIFWHYDSAGGGVWHAAWLDGEMLTYEYPRLVLAQLTLLGRKFWAPHPAKLHLVTKYGANWRTPVTDWDWALGPANVRREDT